MKIFYCVLSALTLLISACSKEPAEIKIARLSVEGQGTYLITYGTDEPVTVKGENNWTTTFSVNPNDTIRLSVKTSDTPATLYMNIEVQEGLLYCKSLYIGPESSGALNHIVPDLP